MEPLGVIRVTCKNTFKDRYVVSFKYGDAKHVGSMVLELTADVAEQFNQGDEFVMSLERVVKHGTAQH